LSAIASVAYKEFLHIYRDRRVLLLLLILPPAFTLVFGHAFEAHEMTNVPALLINRDLTPRAERFMELILANKTFAWQTQPPSVTGEDDLLAHGVQATLIIPKGWNDSLANNDPIPLPLTLMAATRIRRTFSKEVSGKRWPIFSTMRSSS